MSHVEYNFFAPVANARGHFRSLKLTPPFRVERWPHAKIVRLWRQLAWLPKFEIEVQIESSEVVPRDYEVGHVIVGKITLPSAGEEGNRRSTHQRLDELAKQVENQLQLVSLYLCGQVEFAASYWYSLEGVKPNMKSGGLSLSLIQALPGTVNQNSARPLNTFLDSTRLPLRPDYIQTAFEHWQESLSSSRRHIEFFSLVVALETLFNVGAQDIRYRVARSVAVLLGTNSESSDHIFEAIKHAYDVRSKLVHTGRAKGLEKVWFWHLRHIVQEAILRLHELALPKEEVSARLTRLGFGQGAELTANPLEGLATLSS